MQITDRDPRTHGPAPLKRLNRTGFGALVVALLLVACGDRQPTSETVVADASTSPSNPAGPATDGGSGASPDAAGDAGFSLAAIPVSDVPLGDFPYLQLPAGYTAYGAFTKRYPFDRVGFWTGDRIEWLEGKFHVSHIRSDGAGYSPIQVERNIAAVVEKAGGVRVFSGTEPAEVSEEIEAGTSTFRPRYREGLCFHFEPVNVYVIRRADRVIWIRQCSNGDKGGGWIIGESEPFEATAALLPSSQIEQALEERGRIALEVNFATDQAVVLDSSLPQIGEIVSLLEGNDLRLSIEGHTDNTGPADRNRALALARAQAVVDLVVARGIGASRLEAAGFGPDRPVADNATEDGKARNRRVELVSLQ